jgi:hypothetical protein
VTSILRMMLLLGRLSVGVVTLIATMALTATGATAGASTTKMPTQWVSYFPTAVGRTCSLTLPPASTPEGTNIVTTTGHEIETLTAISSSAQGKVFAFRNTVSLRESDGDPADKPAIAPITATQTLKYLLLGNGTVEAPLENQVSLQSEFGFQGHLILPSISSIERGQSDSATVHFNFSPSTPSGDAQVEAITKGHVKSLIGLLRIRISGTTRNSLTTPIGNFKDLIGLRETLIRYTVQNAITPQTASEIDSELIAPAHADQRTTWYAPGRGVVSVWDVSSTGKRTIENTVCGK